MKNVFIVLLLAFWLSPSEAWVSNHPFANVVKNACSATTNKILPTVTATILTTASSPLVARAIEDEEFAELPPPYIPVIFGLGLLVGVGLLTGSLGNVMDEGKPQRSNATGHRQLSCTSCFGSHNAWLVL